MIAAAMRTGLFWMVTVVAISSSTCYVNVHGAQTSDPTGYVCQPGCQLIGNNKCSCFVPPEIEMGPGNQPKYRCKDGCFNQGSTCFCVVPAEKEDDSHSSGECPAPPTKRELIKQCKKILNVHKDPETGSGVCSGSGKIRFADACSGETVTLQCLPDQYIEIHSVFWGRRGEVKCVGKTSGSDCEDTEGRALIYVVSQCEFLSDCPVEADPVKLGDPCDGMLNLLRIKYRCLPAKKAGMKLRVDQVCFGSVLILKCPHNQIIRPQYAIAGHVGAPGNPNDVPSCFGGVRDHVADRSGNSNSNVAKKCSNKKGCSIDVTVREQHGFIDFPLAHPSDDQWKLLYLKVWYYCVRERPIYLGEGPLTEKEKEKYKRNGQKFDDDDSSTTTDETSEEGGI